MPDVGRRTVYATFLRDEITGVLTIDSVVDDDDEYNWWSETIDDWGKSEVNDDMIDNVGVIDCSARPAVLDWDIMDDEDNEVVPTFNDDDNTWLETRDKVASFERIGFTFTRIGRLLTALDDRERDELLVRLIISNVSAEFDETINEFDLNIWSLFNCGVECLLCDVIEPICPIGELDTEPLSSNELAISGFVLCANVDDIVWSSDTTCVGLILRWTSLTLSKWM